jgi:hypothetical protein
VTVSNDPRSPATTADVRAQVALQRDLAGAMRTAYEGYQQADAMRTLLDSLAPPDSTSSLGKTVAAFRARLDSVAGSPPRGFSPFGTARRPDFASLNGRLRDQFMAQENGDLAPTAPMRRAFVDVCRDLTKTLARWRDLTAHGVPSLNATLKTAGRGTLTTARPPDAPACAGDGHG